MADWEERFTWADYMKPHEFHMFLEMDNNTEAPPLHTIEEEQEQEERPFNPMEACLQEWCCSDMSGLMAALRLRMGHSPTPCKEDDEAASCPDTPSSWMKK
jgi:hypothetical protein